MKFIMQAKHYVITLIFSYTLIASNGCLAMNFLQPIEIGCVAISQTSNLVICQLNFSKVFNAIT